MAISQGSWSPASGMRENWLVQVFKTDESAFQAYSFFDQTVNSVAYSGIILNNPSIRESINLFDSRSSLSNVTIEIDNSGNESENLLFGSNYYLNGDVKIFSNLQSGTISNFDNIPQIYFGRLESITHNDRSISLNIVAKRPWENIVIPNSYSAQNILAPLVYGDYTGNSSEFPKTGTDNWYPAPFTNFDTNGANYVTGTTAATSLNPSKYLENFDGFVPYFGNPSNTRTVSGVEVVEIDQRGLYTVHLSPNANSETSTGSDITETNMANIYDEDETSFGTVSIDAIQGGAGTVNQTHVEAFTIPQTGANSLINLKYQVTQLNQTGSMQNGAVQIQIQTSGGNSSTVTKTAVMGSAETIQFSVSSAVTTISVSLQFTGSASSSGGALSIDVKLFELFAPEDKSDDEVKVVYVEADGLAKSFSSGTATKLHEFHRDLFHRFLGITATPVGYSDLDSARSWTGRFWSLKQQPIKKLLDKFAFEGGFVYTYSAAGVLKYIFVKNSYSSADHSLDKNDIANVSISHTSANDLLTDITVNHDKHPAKDSFRSQTTASDSTTRSNYNFATNEGKITQNLDALVSGIGSDITGASNNPNDGFIEYYGNLRNQPRVILRADVVNPGLFDMELGDICSFSSMIPTKAFNKSFSSRFFMVTSLSRSSGKLNAQFIDVTPA